MFGILQNDVKGVTADAHTMWCIYEPDFDLIGDAK